MRKNNGLPPDSPEAYRFAIDYRKLNAITKYPRYPLPVFTLDKDKCHFARDKLKYLGLIISKEVIETDNSKVREIAEKKLPKSDREVSKFLRMAGRPQANLTERVNRNLVQMIACFVKENLENWDRFLHEFSFALRTSVNEATEGAEYVGRKIEKVFVEARQNMRKHNIRLGKNTVIGKGESSDSHVETLYEGQRSSNGSSRSHPEQSKRSRKTWSEESKGRKSIKGNAGWEDPRLKRKVRSNGSVDRKDLKMPKICRNRSLQGSEHRDQKRPTPKPNQGIKRASLSSVSSRNYKYRRPNIPSQVSHSIADP
ncbi:hypothetical protein TNCV_2877171 [Trichonephila clavipes]|uniref:Uncharacterized protein n=1 Tax=Trichonephila clavipes TaxID=2585209 RepID=A0A8X6WDM0_TRICX|nr:hypothetical protein TNCV_2877171 [Trichonephila clavipes]